MTRSKSRRLPAVVTGMAMAAVTLPFVQQARADEEARTETATPIKHVIIIVGENHTFDNLFGTYQPRPGQKIANLLSRGIVRADGSPGPNFERGSQSIGLDVNCGICDPLTGYSRIMKNPTEEVKLQNYGAFLNDVHQGTLPAVSFVRPFEALAGHPADSTTDLYELFLQDLIAQVKSNPKLWASTAIIITTDEGGGYYDSGYIQRVAGGGSTLTGNVNWLEEEGLVNTQRFLIGLTVINCALLMFALAELHPVWASEAAPVLRGSKLEIVDERGRVRASIAVLPGDPTFKMPDGTTGYPETVLLRLINSQGRPNIKIDANEAGAGVLVGGAADPTYASLRAGRTNTALKMSNRDGQQRLIEQ